MSAKRLGVESMARYNESKEMSAIRDSASTRVEIRARYNFFFYIQPDPSAGAPDPGKKRPCPASGDGQEEACREVNSTLTTAEHACSPRRNAHMVLRSRGAVKE
jgi:hypothetical protein